MERKRRLKRLERLGQPVKDIARYTTLVALNKERAQLFCFIHNS